MSVQLQTDVLHSQAIVVAKLGYGKADNKLETLGEIFGALSLPIMAICGVYFGGHALWIVPVIFLTPFIAFSLNARRGKLWLERRGDQFMLIRDPYRSEQREEIPVAGIKYGWNYESIHHQSSNGGLYRKADGSTIVPIGSTQSCGLTVVFYGIEDEAQTAKLALHEDLNPWVNNPLGWNYLPVDDLLGTPVYPIYGSLKSFVKSIETEREHIAKSAPKGNMKGTIISFKQHGWETPRLNTGA